MTQGPSTGAEFEPEAGVPPTGEAGEPQDAAAPPADPGPGGVVSEDAEAAEPADEAGVDELAELRAQLAERTGDLQRLQAEFLNYKRRVERDRDLVRENAVFAVLTPMLDVLDSIDRARDAGELEGGFKGVAEQLERVVASLGLTRFGQPGDAFDPTLHDALSHVGTDPDVDVVTCKHVAKAGYRIGERVMRPAQVLVVDPAEPSVPAPAEAGEDAVDQQG